MDYIRSLCRRATFLLLVVLCAAGVSAGAVAGGEAPDSEREQAAALGIANAQAALDAGDVVAAGALLIQVVNAYPDTEARFDGYPVLEEALKRLSSGRLPFEVLSEFEANLPSVKDLTSAEARHILHAFFLSRATLLDTMGMPDLAQSQLQSAGESVLETLGAYPGEAWHVGAVPAVFEAAVTCAPEYAHVYAEALETFVARSRPSMAAFCARSALVGYYLHEGMDRKVAEKHMTVLLNAASSALIAEALLDPFLRDTEKACLLWAKGYAAYEMGQHQTALGVFQQIAAELPDAGREKAWAELTIPAAYRKLYPADPSLAEAAYRDYLSTHEGHECAQWALLELGNIALEDGRLDEAASYFSRIETEFPAGDAVPMASSGLKKVIELKALERESGAD